MSKSICRMYHEKHLLEKAKILWELILVHDGATYRSFLNTIGFVRYECLSFDSLLMMLIRKETLTQTVLQSEQGERDQCRVIINRKHLFVRIIIEKSRSIIDVNTDTATYRCKDQMNSWNTVFSIRCVFDTSMIINIFVSFEIPMCSSNECLEEQKNHCTSSTVTKCDRV